MYIYNCPKTFLAILAEILVYYSIFYRNCADFFKVMYTFTQGCIIYILAFTIVTKNKVFYYFIILDVFDSGSIFWYNIFSLLLNGMGKY